MNATLRASSALRQLLLFDPGSVDHLFARDRRPDPLDWARQTRQGNAIRYFGRLRGESGGVIRVYVDETPDEQILRRRERPVHGYLCVPAGELCLVGLEDVDMFPRNPSPLRLPPGTRTALLHGVTFGPGAFPTPGFEVVVSR